MEEILTGVKTAPIATSALPAGSEAESVDDDGDMAQRLEKLKA